jgi:serine/threonine protein kinase
LKTANILLNEKIVAKISDFGLSKYLITMSREKIFNKDSNEIGTPAYQSPEQFPQNTTPSVGKPADVYGFGSILYEILFEIPPW